MTTRRLTTGQALINYLAVQHVERDGNEARFFAGLWGIFGHGNIGGVAQAIQQAEADFPYYLTRNEQAMVHAAVGYAKLKNRLGAFACLTSIGPGATNMVTGAASATINHVPVLLMAGDAFAERVQSPVLQQLEWPGSQDTSANDTFRPVVRYWDRINRPEQLITALPEVMRILTSPADTGAVFLGLPQDIQTYAFDFPVEMFEKRIWSIPRNRPDRNAVATAAEWIRASKRPVIFAGGGVRYSEATDALRAFAEQTGIPVAETHAGKGSMPYDHPLSLGGAGVSGTLAANVIAPEADLVIGIGTRFTDFPTASKTAFQDPDVRFININVAEFDAFKHAAVPLVGDARATLEELASAVGDYSTPDEYRARVLELNREWDAEVERVYHHSVGDILTQGEVIGAVEASTDPRDVVVTSAGSLPGDLLKLWRSRDAASYQVEYGYSTMGYEIAGGVGAKLAAPDREVYRHGRRRLVPDDEQRDHDRRPGGPQAHRRARGQQGLLQRRPRVGAGGRRGLRLPLPAPRPVRRLRRTGDAARLRQDLPGHGREGPRGQDPRRAPRRAGRCPRGHRDRVHRRPDRLGRAGPGLRQLLVGDGDAEGLRDAGRQRRARGVRPQQGPPAVPDDPGRPVPAGRHGPVTRHVGPLLRPAHEPGPDGAIHRIRPADAGWRFVSFDVHRLAAGGRVARAGDDQEVLVLVLEGTASVSVGGVRMGAVGTRATVFDEAPAGVVLCAPGEDVEVVAEGDVLLGIAAAPAGDVHRTAVIAPETILVETRGEGSSERTIKNLLPPSAEAGRLIAVEAYTPGGNWSSYPPHKHDTDDPPNESQLEELYFYRFERPTGFAIQRVYTADRSLDETMTAPTGT